MSITVLQGELQTSFHLITRQFGENKVIASVNKQKKYTYIAIFDDDVVISHLPIVVVVVVKCGI